MSLFSRRERKQTSGSEISLPPLVAGLVSNDESTFLTSLQQAVAQAEGGDYEGIRSLREAIRIRSGKAPVDFYQPGIRTDFGVSAPLLGLICSTALHRQRRMSLIW